MKKGLVTALIGAAAYCAGAVFLPWQSYELAQLSVTALEVHWLTPVFIAIAIGLAGIAGWGIASGRKVVASRAILGGGLALVVWLVAAVVNREWSYSLMAYEGVTMGAGFVLSLAGALLVFGGGATSLVYAPRWDEETPVLRIRATPEDPRSPAREVIVYEPRAIELGRELGLDLGAVKARLTPECEVRLELEPGARVSLDGDARRVAHRLHDQVVLGMGDRARVALAGVELRFDYVRQTRNGTRKLVLGSEAVAAALVVLLVFLALGVGTILGWDEDATRIIPDEDRRSATIAALTEEDRKNEPEIAMPIETALVETQQQTKAIGGPEGKIGDTLAPVRPTKIPPRDASRVKPGATPQDKGVVGLLEDPNRPSVLADIFDNTGDFQARFASAVTGNDDEFVAGRGTNGLGLSDDGSGGPGVDGTGKIQGMGDWDNGEGPARVAVALKPKERRTVPNPVGPNPPPMGGFCKREQIASAVARRAGMIRGCYEQRLVTNESLRGKITVRWTIGLDGKVMSADATSDSLGDPTTTGCVLRTIRNIKFALPDGGTCVVSWPFVFSPG